MLQRYQEHVERLQAQFAMMPRKGQPEERHATAAAHTTTTTGGAVPAAGMRSSSSSSLDQTSSYPPPPRSDFMSTLKDVNRTGGVAAVTFDSKTIVEEPLRPLQFTFQGQHVRTGPLQHPVSASLPTSQSSSFPHPVDKYKEILSEVQLLSSTVTSLQKERAEAEEQWALRLRSLREELERREQSLFSANEEVRRLQSEGMQQRSTITKLQKDVLTAKESESKMLGQAEMEAAQLKKKCANLEHKVASLTEDADQREALLAAQDRALTELEHRQQESQGMISDLAAKLDEVTALRSTEHDAVVDGQQCTKRLKDQLQLSLRWVERLFRVCCVSIPTFLRQELRASLQALGCLNHRSTTTTDAPSKTSEPIPADAGPSRTLENVSAVLDSLFRTMIVIPNSKTGTDVSVLPPNVELDFQSLKKRMEKEIDVYDHPNTQLLFGPLLESDALSSPFVSLNHAVAKLQAELQRSREEKENLDILLGKASTSVKEGLNEINMMREDAERQEQFVAAAQKQLQDAQTLNGQLRDEIGKRERTQQDHSRSLQELLSGRDSDIQRLKSKIAELEATIVRHNSSKTLLVEEAKSEASTLRAALREKDERISALMFQVDHLKQDAADLQEAHSLQLSEIEKRFQSATQDLEAQHLAEVRELQKANDEHNKILDALAGTTASTLFTEKEDY